MNEDLITFIIPTIGRPTLKKSLESLLSQTVTCWRAIVVFDGADINLPVTDDRIKAIKIDKVGSGGAIHGIAGSVRNIGMQEVNTEWIGFLDDDDTISHKYVERLAEEISINPNAKCIIFRMLDGMTVLPRPQDKDFVEDKVGISFAINKELNKKFIPSQKEDFMFLNNLRNEKCPMVISPYVNYFVRMPINNFMDNKVYSREIINL